MKNELWKPIPTLSPYYASSLGRISKKIPNKTDLIMWTRVQKGYERLMLTVQPNMRKGFLVHRLVAMAFHGLPAADKKEVNHIDGDKQNNTPNNLEWVSRSDNLNHYYQSLDGIANRPRGIKQWQAKFTDDDVRAIRLMAKQGNTAKQISAYLHKNVTPNNVCNILARRTYKSVSD